MNDNEMRIKGDDTAEGQSENSYRFLPKDASNSHFRGIELDIDENDVGSSLSGAESIHAPNSAKNKNAPNIK